MLLGDVWALFSEKIFSLPSTPTLFNQYNSCDLRADLPGGDEIRFPLCRSDGHRFLGSPVALPLRTGSGTPLFRVELYALPSAPGRKAPFQSHPILEGDRRSRRSTGGNIASITSGKGRCRGTACTARPGKNRRSGRLCTAPGSRRRGAVSGGACPLLPDLPARVAWYSTRETLTHASF
jgi:hypothetical protein